MAITPPACPLCGPGALTRRFGRRPGDVWVCLRCDQVFEVIVTPRPRGEESDLAFSAMQSQDASEIGSENKNAHAVNSGGASIERFRLDVNQSDAIGHDLVRSKAEMDRTTQDEFSQFTKLAEKLGAFATNGQGHKLEPAEAKLNGHIANGKPGDVVFHAMTPGSLPRCGGLFFPRCAMFGTTPNINALKSAGRDRAAPGEGGLHPRHGGRRICS